MKIWEYLTEYGIKYYDLGRRLDIAGKDGWELVALEYIAGDCMIVMKREFLIERIK